VLVADPSRELSLEAAADATHFDRIVNDIVGEWLLNRDWWKSCHNATSSCVCAPSEDG
jgi:hypothetical protein